VKKDKSHRWSSKVSSYKGKKRSGLFSMLSHTEKKVCTKARAKGIGKGDTLVIKGTLPPCSTCKAFMKDLAKQKGCNIKYQYKEGGKTKTWKYPP
jgi:cytidine deaminase